MAEQNKGFIKLDRNIVRWRWWKNPNTLHTFLTILLLANYKDCDFEKDVIHRGQLATSHKTLSGLTSLTISQLRTALSNLKSTGEIAITRRPRYLVITVINYNKYQDVSNQIADKSQTNDNQIAIKSQQSKKNTINSIQERKKEKKGRSAPVPPSGFSDKSYAEMMPDMDKGTVDDIPAEYRDQFDNYADYWRFRNR